MKRYYLLLVSVLLFSPFIKAQDKPFYHKGLDPNRPMIVPGSPTPETSGQSGTGSNIDVLYHKIYWRLNPDSTSTPKYIKGSVQTNFKTIVANVSSINFDLRSTLTVDSVKFRGAKLPGGNVTRVGNTVVIALGVTLANNFIDSVTIFYQGVPPNVVGAAEGFQNGTDAGAGKYLMTLSESYEDRDWWPCKADMQDKIDSMDITVNVPWATPTAADTFWVASNGKLVDSTITGSTRSFTFKSRYPIASYLVCVSVAKFNRYYRVVNINGTNVQVVYNLFRGKSAGTYTSILTQMDSMNLALVAFSNKFGDYPFKLEKHGFYDGLLGAGGMEHQTFSAIQTGATLQDSKTLAHELMHQWFGDNVTFGTWNDLWLAEGFARYSEALYYEIVANHPVSAYQVRKTHKTAALGNTAQGAWIPNSSMGTSDLVWNTPYGTTVYERGAMIVSMLRTLCGDAKYFQAVTNYQTALAGKSATADSLKNYFNAVLGTDISSFFNDYVGGSGPGASAVGGVGNPINNINWNSPVANKLVIQVGSQTRTAGSNVTYFRGPVVLHVTASGKDTTIVFYDWGSGNLSYAGNGLSDPIPGNILNYTLSFTPTAVAYDDSARTMSTGSATNVPALKGYTWLGTTNSTWSTSTNWDANLGLPPSGAQVSIATTGSQPALAASTVVDLLDIRGANTLTIGSNTLTVNGALVGTGTLTGSSTSNLTIGNAAGTINFTQTTAATRSLNNLTFNSGSSGTLGNALEIYGSIGLTASTVDLNGVSLTLKSNATATARIADLTGSTLSNATNVTVERYIPANSNRAWRLLSVPTTGQTIKQSWQENQAAGATTPAGQGVQITGSIASWSADGFDFNTAGTSMLTYNYMSNAWQNIGPTSSAIATTSGYMLYIRGDRTATPGNALITATTLRTKGTIYQGTQTALPVVANKFALIGNVYPSTIDFRNVTRTGGVDATFYVWDPKLVGSGSGAYQTFTLSGANYIVTPGGGSYGVSGSISNTIQSGSAFLVHATTTAGTVQLFETSKTAGSAVVFSPTTVGERLITNLYAVSGGINKLADGSMVLYDNTYSNDVDGSDARKMNNFGENIGMLRNDSNLVVEKRTIIGATDTVFYKLVNLKQQPYQLELVADNLDHPGLVGMLIDNYLTTSTPLNLNGTTTVDFTVDANPGSSANNRFMVVFGPAVPLPVSFTGIRAWQTAGPGGQSNDIAVEWKVENQLNISRYEVEKSVDGRNFSKVAVQNAIGINGSGNTYNWLDMNAVAGDNFYRIRSIGLSGDIKYSAVAVVKIAKGNPVINVFPNPVSDRTITVQFAGMDKGYYTVRLLSNNGQVLMTKQINHNGGSASQTILLSNTIAKGSYQLEIVQPDNKKTVQGIVVE